MNFTKTVYIILISHWCTELEGREWNEIFPRTYNERRV